MAIYRNSAVQHLYRSDPVWTPEMEAAVNRLAAVRTRVANALEQRGYTHAPWLLVQSVMFDTVPDDVRQAAEAETELRGDISIDAFGMILYWKSLRWLDQYLQNPHAVDALIDRAAQAIDAWLAR